MSKVHYHPLDIAVIDKSVGDYRSLINNAENQGMVVITIESDESGIEQLINALNDVDHISTLSIFSHGQPGVLHLGGDRVTVENLDEFNNQLSQIAGLLVEGSEILLYGCEIGSGESGVDLIRGLANKTGVDVAASDDLTGNPEYAGNWELEVFSGKIDREFSGAKEFSGTLGAFADDFLTNTGQTSSFTRMLDGVNFTYTFESSGDAGDIAWESQYGDGNSASLNLLSNSPDSGAIETFTIARTDGADFVFSSLFVNNTAGNTVTIGGYNNNSLVGSTQTVAQSQSNTLSFSNITVDQVRVTSTDFLNTNIDTFTGNTTVVTNTQPSLDLNGNGAGTNSNIVFTENNGAALIAGSATLSDVDGDNIQSLTVELMSRPDGDASESLDLTSSGVDYVSGAGLVSNYQSATGVLTITGSAMASVYQSILRQVTYNNSSEAPDTTNRIVNVEVSDGTDNSEERAATVAVTSRNDAPELDSTKSITITSVDEDSLAPEDGTTTGAGQGATSVSTLLTGVSDVDSGADKGIAITSVTDNNASLHYSLDGGDTWEQATGITEANALHLAETDLLYYQPGANTCLLYTSDAADE